MRRYRVQHRVQSEGVKIARLGCVLDQHDLEDIDRENCAVRTVTPYYLCVVPIMIKMR